tara:strand:- start:1695 stop:2156 length:462 start_codon:yes stop_codon:yes gene_type:complete
MVDHMLIDTPGRDDNGDGAKGIVGTYYENHKGFSIPEFYKKTVLSGDTNNMPEDAPFRYQGASPVKCLTDYTAPLEFSSFTILKSQNLGIKSNNGFNRLDKMIRTYGMAIAREDLLKRRISFLNEALQESLDWIDTQGDEYGYDQSMTAVTED